MLHHRGAKRLINRNLSEQGKPKSLKYVFIFPTEQRRERIVFKDGQAIPALNTQEYLLLDENWQAFK